MAERVLLVDDDDFIRDMLKEMLSSHEVFEAENGAEAVEMYIELHPDIVLMDILMPVMDGIEATRRIMSIDPKAIVIGISAFSAVKGEDMRMAGAREVLPKPLRVNDLLAVIEKYHKVVKRRS